MRLSKKVITILTCLINILIAGFSSAQTNHNDAIGKTLWQFDTGG